MGDSQAVPKLFMPAANRSGSRSPSPRSCGERVGVRGMHPRARTVKSRAKPPARTPLSRPRSLAPLLRGEGGGEGHASTSANCEVPPHPPDLAMLRRATSPRKRGEVKEILRQTHNLARVSAQFQNVHASIG